MSTETTREVIEHHLAALEVGDIDEVMKDYSDDSVFIINLGGVLTSLEAIRGFFVAAGLPKGFTRTDVRVEGDVFYVTWVADGITFGTDTLIVREGTIVAQTVAVVLG